MCKTFPAVSEFLRISHQQSLRCVRETNLQSDFESDRGFIVVFTGRSSHGSELVSRVEPRSILHSNITTKQKCFPHDACVVQVTPPYPPCRIMADASRPPRSRELRSRSSKLCDEGENKGKNSHKNMWSEVRQ